jgi:cobalt-zinc-cadmium efflux system protein
MAHAHAEHAATQGWRFGVGAALNLAFVGVEAAVGLLFGSLALVADAGHNLGDVLTLLLAWGAAHLARTPPSGRRTYGLKSTTILAALANAMLLLVAVGAIGMEAIRRLREPEPAPAGMVMIVAGIGIVVNLATAFLFVRQSRDVNVRGAFLHMVADAAVSFGVLVAGVVMQITGWPWIDAAVSLAIAGLILWSTWGLLRESLDLALHAVPAGIDREVVENHLRQLPGVASVHDLHIWALSTTETALTAHLVVPTMDGDALVRTVAAELHDRFGIEHVTIQIERDAATAGRCPPECR